mgnify:CR=1 FL=1
MPTERYNLGSSPHLTISTRASLRLRGGDREDVKIEGSSNLLEVTDIEGGLHIDTNGDIDIRMPIAGSAAIETIHGSAYIRDIAGNVTVGSVYGDCHARRLASFQITEVYGSANIREVSGAVSIDTVRGGLSLRSISGPIAINEVKGPLLGREIGGDLLANILHGSVLLRTGFAAGTTCQLKTINGQVHFRVPPDADVRFVLPAEADLQLNASVKPVHEGDKLVVLLGEGAALVQVDQVNGGVLIRQEGAGYKSETGEMDDEFISGMIDLSSQLETHLSAVESHLNARLGELQSRTNDQLSDKLRRKVERELDAARRHVEAAQRRAERAAEHTTERPSRVFTWAVDTPRGKARRSGEPVSEEERLMVLSMLEEGKISVEEAEALLSAMEGDA